PQKGALDGNRQLVAVELNALDCIRLPGEQAGQFGPIFQLFEVGDCRFQGHGQILSALPCLFQSITPFFQIYQYPASTMPIYTSISQKPNILRSLKMIAQG